MPPPGYMTLIELLPVWYYIAAAMVCAVCLMAWVGTMEDQG